MAGGEMSTVLRGQEGFPTGQEREPAGPIDPTVESLLPSAADWQEPAQAEAALEATRDALAPQQRGETMEVDRTTQSTRDVDDMEQIEAEVAPGRTAGEEQAPTEESSND
jgi:hypothetical protein